MDKSMVMNRRLSVFFYILASLGATTTNVKTAWTTSKEPFMDGVMLEILD